MTDVPCQDYLDRAKEIRVQTRPKLFIHMSPAKVAQPASKATLDPWMTTAIRYTYSVLGKEDQIIVTNPHSVQGLIVALAEYTS